jgi:hypothetical protein
MHSRARLCSGQNGTLAHHARDGEMVKIDGSVLLFRASASRWLVHDVGLSDVKGAKRHDDNQGQAGRGSGFKGEVLRLSWVAHVRARGQPRPRHNSGATCGREVKARLGTVGAHNSMQRAHDCWDKQW